ncbi:MAG TPA: 50S ribosomal protein L25 [bacterium]|nr:50S ribosomal protein L25 [bacterium]
MERVSLSAQVREATGKSGAKRARREGQIPAVVYGRGRTPRVVSVGRKDLVSALQTAGRNALIDLRIAQDGDAQTEVVMIEEIQRDHIRREILHVDLHLISLTEAIEVSVPVVLSGTPEGVTSGGGVLEQVHREIEVKCLPTQIPDRFTVDVSGLRVGGSIHVSDLKVAEGIEILTPPEEVIAAVVAAAAEEEAAPAAAAEGEAPAEPELVGRAAAEGEAAPAEEGAKGGAKAEGKPAKAEAKPAKSEKKE